MADGGFKTGRLRPALLLLSDLAVLSAAIAAAFGGYKLLGGRYSMLIVLRTWPIPVLVIAINLSAKLYCGNLLYPGLAVHPVEELRRLTLSCLGSFMTFFALLTFTRSNIAFSRVALAIAMVLSLLLLPIGRLAMRYLLWRFHIGFIPAVIVGDAKMVRMVLKKLASDTARILDIKASCCASAPVRRIPNLSPEELRRFSREQRISYLICCNGESEGDYRIENYLPDFLHILVVNGDTRFPVLWSYPVSFYRFFSFEVSNRLLHRAVRVQKRLMEILFATVTLLLLFLPGVVLALLVKLTSRGPVFYRAARLGQNGAPIEVLKFRTMRVGADGELPRMLAENPELKAQWERNYKLDHDPRVTRFGAFLRKTSLDELPQFWNILKGEMALIGPRPIVPDEVRYYGKDYATFASVKPGITGLWQVSGRSDTDYETRVGLDVFYVNNWSIWMDYYIFFRTIFVIILGRGAY